MYNGIQVFDIHGHVSSPAAARGWVVGLLGANATVPSPLAPGGNRGGRGGVDLSDEAFVRAAKEHLDYMDARDIDVQLISHRPFLMMGWMEPHLLPAWTAFTNDCIKKQVDAFPDRFIGAAMLPQDSAAPDLSHCLPELQRCVNELGFAAVYLSPDPGGKRTTPGMNTAYWYPVYEKCQELGLPIIVHGTNCLDPRLAVLPNNVQWGFLYEQFIAMQLLTHSDVFDRFPQLKVCVCHGGGHLNRFIKTDPILGQKDYSKNLFFDTCVYDIPLLQAVIQQKGVKNILYGTEAPGAGGAVRPETGKTSDDLIPVISAFNFLTEDDKKDIFHNNLVSFLPAFEKTKAAVGAR